MSVQFNSDTSLCTCFND